MLIAPSDNTLQTLFDICQEFADEKDSYIPYNAKKSNCLVFLPKWLGDLEDHSFTLNCKTIENTSEHCYLGVDLCNALFDTNAVRKQLKCLYFKGNMIIKYFNNCSTDVKCQLFIY